MVAEPGDGHHVQPGGHGGDGDGAAGAGDGGAEGIIYGAYQAGYDGVRDQSGMAGVADGLSAWMDGHRMWGCEPDRGSRVKRKQAGWQGRAASLGNAVVPQQVYPILKCIADLETGRCREHCACMEENRR